MPKSALSYCAEQVRRQDHDRYVTALFAPAHRREGLFALYAFNLEIAKTAEVVSEDLLGRLRLQWWRECLDEVYAGRPLRHAVVEPLAAAVHRHGLGRAHFDRLIDAREDDLAAEPPADLAALENYAEGTSASLVHLALEILGVPAGSSTGANEAGRRLGLAWALTGLARAVPFHARQKRLYLPSDMAAQAGLDTGALFELRRSEALSRVVAQLAARASEHLAAARALRRELPRRAFPAMLLGPLAERHLKVLNRAGFDPFDRRVLAQPSGSAWRLAWAVLKRRY
jgi:phytoene synthase